MGGLKEFKVMERIKGIFALLREFWDEIERIFWGIFENLKIFQPGKSF